MQEEFRSKSDVKKTGERYDFRPVFRRFLAIHEFVLHGGTIQNYFRSRRVRWSIREVQDNAFSFSIISLKFGCMHQIFGKSGLSKRFCDFGRPCRGLSPGKGFAPEEDIPYDSYSLSMLLE